MIYADNAATTKMSRTAIDAMLPYLEESFGNPSSLYALGQRAAEALQTARERVAACIRAGEDRTQADRDFHAAIVRATHNEFMTRLLPIINQAVETAIVSGGRGEELARSTLRDHALLMEFFQKRDPDGARHAMAIHMRHAMDEMGLELY